MSNLPVVVALGILAAGLQGCAAGPEAVYIEQAYEELSEPAPDLARAHAWLHEALEIAPDNPYALLDMGVVYHHAGRFLEAADYYDRVIAMGAREDPPRENKEWAEDLDLVEIARHNMRQLAAGLPPERRLR